MYAHPEYLTDVDQLAEDMANDDGSLRIYDTSVHLLPASNGYKVESGYDDYLSAHIPGAGFIDLADDWAKPHSTLRFTLPDMQDLQAQIGKSGIGRQNRVVLYSSGHLMWATRAWWLLYHAGHRNIAILNGNFTAWRAAGQPTESGARTYPATTFEADPAQSAFADTETVAQGMHGATCTINSLSKSLYEGTGDFYYKRRGHIPGSLSLYYDQLLDNDHFLPRDQLSELLEERGALSADRVITYCGGGIAATLDAFACLLCGQQSVQVYDGSMSEWVQDDARPLTAGAKP